MKNPEKQWIKKVDAAIILVMRRCLRNYSLIFFGLTIFSFVLLRIDFLSFKVLFFLLLGDHLATAGDGN